MSALANPMLYLQSILFLFLQDVAKSGYRGHECAFEFFMEWMRDQKHVKILDLAAGTGMLGERVSSPAMMKMNFQRTLSNVLF